MDVVRGLRPANGQDGFGFFMPAFTYENDGVAATIVDRPAEDAISRGFKIEGDEDETVLNEMDRLNATIHFTDAMRWARLYGASAILVLARDGRSLGQPLDLSKLQIIEDLVVYSGDMIQPETERYADPTVRNYGLPMRYRLSPMQGNSFVVHETRLIKFTGDPMPPSRKMSVLLPWQGRSCLEACRSDLARYRAGLTLSRQIMERKQQAVHAMAGLSELLASQEGQDLVRQKIALTDAVRGVLNGITIDGGPGNGVGDGDDYKIIDLSLGGIDSVMGEFRDALAGSSRMPQVVLFGSDVQGLGSVGAGEQGIYHALVKSIQERGVRPAMEEFAGMIWAQTSVPQSEPEKWRLVFSALWSPTEVEMADIGLKKAQERKTHMEAVQITLDSYLVSPEEAREAATMAFPELELDPAKVPEQPPEPDPNDTLPGGTGEGAGGPDAGAG